VVAAKPPEHRAEEEPLQLGYYGPIPSFTSDEEELKWLYFQEEETKAMLKMKAKASLLHYPNDDGHWPGDEPKPDLSYEIPQEVKDRQWRKVRNAQISLQKAINEKVAKDKAKCFEEEVGQQKRQAEGLLQSLRKRRKFSNKRRKEYADRAAERQKASRPRINIKPRATQADPAPLTTTAPAATSPTTTSPSKYPSTIDQTLLHALQEGNIWDAEVQNAIDNSLKTFAGEAKKSLAIRAASLNMTEDQYAQTQGYKNAAAYLASHVKDATADTQPSPISPQKPRTERAKQASHLEEYQNDMLKAIKEGIANRGLTHGFPSPDDFAKDRGYANLDAWTEAELKQMNITIDIIPSRKHASDMTPAEQYVDDAVWREWVGRLNAAASWEERIAGLPRGPGWSQARKQSGKTYAAV
jgi:hypothetical protein